MTDRPLYLGLAGYGTVGAGLARILEENGAEIAARTGRRIAIRRVLVRDASKTRPYPYPAGAEVTENPADLFKDSEVDVLVEVMGGVEAPKLLIETALRQGKHVVTANKALLAETGNHLFALAAEKGLHLAFEASVCGGIPIIQTLREGLAANRVLSLMGILNGTSNYILSEMTTRKLPFAEALQQAQELGYAEADPALDVEGGDAAHKLALLIRMAWGAEYPFEAMPVRGISGVTPQDIAYAREFGCRIKLVGHARLADDGAIEASVEPTLVDETYLLARVGGAYNAVRVEGNAAGSVFLHGKGAGDLPTGSAVLSDILRIASGARPNNTGFINLPGKARAVPEMECRSRFYLRLEVTDKPGVLRDIAAVMADNEISIAQVIQKGQAGAGSDIPSVPFIVMTHEASTAGVHKAVKALAASPLVHEPPVYYRVLHNTK